MLDNEVLQLLDAGLYLLFLLSNVLKQGFQLLLGRRRRQVVQVLLARQFVFEIPVALHELEVVGVRLDFGQVLHILGHAGLYLVEHGVLQLQLAERYRLKNLPRSPQ